MVCLDAHFRIQNANTNFMYACFIHISGRCGTKFVLFCCLQLEVWSDNPGEARIYETILDGGRHASAPYYILQWSRRLRSLVLDHMFRSTAGLTTSKAEKCECVSDFPHWSADLTRTMEVFESTLPEGARK